MKLTNYLAKVTVVKTIKKVVTREVLAEDKEKAMELILKDIESSYNTVVCTDYDRVSEGKLLSLERDIEIKEIA